MFIRKYTFRAFLFVGFCCAAMTGCMVGPNFHPPGSPQLRRFTETPLPHKTAKTPSLPNSGKSQTYVNGANIPSDWWYLFRSPVINYLVTRGIANSPNLAAAYASLRNAQEVLNAQIGNSLLPAFNGVTSGERQKFSGASFGTPTSSIFNLFNVSVNVSYTLDVFGGARRQIEALQAQVDNQQFQLIAAYLTLTSNIVTTTVTIASLQEQIDATKKLIKAQAGILTILRKQFKLGGIALETVLTQETLVEQTRATLPPLENSFSQSRHALAALIGTYPNEPLPQVKLNAIHLPARLPVSLPSQIVRQRPDVRASEALLHAAMAQIGVATANLLPTFNITGNYGWEATIPSQLFGTTTNVWSIMGQVTQPLFHGGALLAQRRAAIAAFEQACAQYRQVVLQAFQNVADTLRALETDARTLSARRIAENAAKHNFVITQHQYFLGGVSYLNLLNAQQQYHTTQISRIQAEATRYNDTAALFQALGGGWWNKPWCVKECLYEA